MGFIDYLRETKTEWHHIAWPSRRQAVAFTVLVLALSALAALYLGAFDALLTFVVEKIVG